MASTASPTRSESTTDQLGPVGVNRTSQIVTTIIAANTTLQVYQGGDNFYLVVATAQVSIKPNNGSENNYVQGTGLKVDSLNIFKSLQIRNPNANAVVIQLFVGFGGYIDNRLIVYDPNVTQVAYPTYPVTSTENQILIPDKSAQPITDQNGKVYLALNRTAIIVSNLDTGIVLSITASSDPTKALIAIQPATNIIYQANGNFQIKIPSGNINAIVSEIYNAILPT